MGFTQSCLRLQEHALKSAGIRPLRRRRAELAETSFVPVQWHGDGSEMKIHTRTRVARSHHAAAESRPERAEPAGQVLFALLGNDAKTRLRIKQWSIAATSYASGGMVLAINYLLGWVDADQLAALLGIIAVLQATFYVALRSGLSARCKDPSLTVTQIITGILFANWAFLISGPGRAVALMPMLLVLVFGAFLLDWKKIAALTVVALASFSASIVALHWPRWTTGPGSSSAEEWSQDLLYFASAVLLLPMAGVLAAQVSRMHAALRAQRGALGTALDEVRRLAEFDELTGLANRRHATGYLSIQHAHAIQSGAGLSVALIDLDNFKRINDTLGHGAGDNTLRAFADAARPLMRASDLMARWGGEEFLIVMPNTPPEQAYKAALRLLERIRAFPLEHGGPLSFSAGIAQWKDGEPIADTVARADRRMYAAKLAGRNQVCMAG